MQLNHTLRFFFIQLALLMNYRNAPETELDLEKTAIERIRTASQMSLQHYGLPLVVTDSGGKDSAVCRELVRRSGVPFS